MRSNLLSSCLRLWLALLPSSAFAGDPWVYLGDLRSVKTGASAKLSLNLETLRRRGNYYEIWERLAFAADPRQAAPAADADEVGERFTLWAIRCGRGAMARVTERVTDAFEPRAESLRFYIPMPESAGAVVIETACAEVRRVAAEKRVRQAGDGNPKEKAALQSRLDYPPPVPDDADFDEGDE